jgi:hypothetical protein
MADAANFDEPGRDIRAKNNPEITPEDGGKDEKTANLPDINGPEAEKAQPGSNGAGQPKKPSIFKRIWGKLGLDLPTAMMMFKLVYASHLPVLSFTIVH